MHGCMKAGSFRLLPSTIEKRFPKAVSVMYAVSCVACRLCFLTNVDLSILIALLFRFELDTVVSRALRLLSTRSVVVSLWATSLTTTHTCSILVAALLLSIGVCAPCLYGLDRLRVRSCLTRVECDARHWALSERLHTLFLCILFLNRFELLKGTMKRVL